MIEAMKQALEALERSVATCFDQYAHQQAMSQPDHFINQAITSLRQAIAEAEKQEPYGWVSQHTTKGMYEWQFNKELSGVYKDTAISILPVHTYLQPKQDNTELDAICQDLQEKTYTQAMRIAELEAKLAEKQEPVTWGVDWGKAGDTPCVSIIKRLLDGRIEVVAVEYAPYTNPQPNITTSDMKQEHVDKTAKQRHEENT